MILVCSLLGAACAGADARDDGFTVRDSAGIRVAESVAPVVGGRGGLEPESGAGGDGSSSTNPPFFLTRQQNTRDGEIALAYTEDFEILLHGASGDVTGIVRHTFEPAPITEAQIDAWKSFREQSFLKQPSRSSDGAARRRAVIDEMTFPASHPVLAWNGSMLVSASGDIWVQHAGAPTAMGTAEASPTWSVFDREGRWLGEGQIPASFRPMDIGEDQTLGVAADELGVEYVQRYAIRSRLKRLRARQTAQTRGSRRRLASLPRLARQSDLSSRGRAAARPLDHA